MKTLVHVPRRADVVRWFRIPRPSMGTLMLMLLMLKIGADILRRRREARHEVSESN